MRKVILYIGIVVFLYFGSVFIRSYLWESEVEGLFEEIVVEIARPWDKDKLDGRSSWWLREKSNLTTSEIVNLAKKDLGNLVKVFGKPSCNLQKGFDRYSEKEHTYAVCVASLQMEKKSRVDMKVRMIHENGVWKINDFVSVE